MGWVDDYESLIFVVLWNVIVDISNGTRRFLCLHQRSVAEQFTLAAEGIDSTASFIGVS